MGKKETMLCDCFTDFILYGTIAALLTIIIQFVYRLLTIRNSFRKTIQPSVREKNWEQNVVYFYQFPRSKYTLASMSPFCAKLELFLLVNNIKYKTINTKVMRSREGKLPFIELNGEQLHDTSLIIMALRKHFKILNELNEEQSGIVTAITEMLDSNIFHQILYNKIGTNVDNFLEYVVSDLSKFIKFLLKPFIYEWIWNLLNACGEGRHSQEEIELFLRSNLEALDGILGNKEWFVNNKPSEADCSFFGHVSTCINLPYNLPIHHMLREEFPRLFTHYERITQKFYAN